MTPTRFAKLLYTRFLYLIWRGYKLYISPLIGHRCRFYPTCSHYAYLLLAHESIFHAIPSICYRLARCQPLAQGGIEYPIITHLALFSSPIITPSFLSITEHSHTLPHITHWLIPLASQSTHIKTHKHYLRIIASITCQILHIQHPSHKHTSRKSINTATQTRYILIPSLTHTSISQGVLCHNNSDPAPSS